jgi:hypothetical protein
MRVLFWLALVLMAATPARADVLAVGAGKAFATPCAAILAAKPADVIEIAAATYTDTCAITVAGLTLRGVGGRPKVDLSGTDHPAQYKGIYVIAADDVTVENLELAGAHISAENGLNAAGLRVEAKNLTVRSCFIHDNQNGILGGTSGTITIEYSEFARNAAGDGCNQGGCTHNLYIAGVDTLNFRYNWSHRLATDTPDKGHLLKSRAKANYILYNRLSGEDGFDSYELDLPNGGLAVVVGNVIQKGAQSGNGALMAWGEEGASNPDKRVFIVGNTFVNDRSSGAFLNASGASLTVHDNIFAGTGSVPAMLGADNLAGTDPEFVDRAHFDYHLRSTSPARGKAVDPGKADQFALTPEYEYLHPAGRIARAKAADLGAFEFAAAAAGTGGAGAGGAAGGDGPAADGGERDAGSAEARDASDALPGAGRTQRSPASDGCACSTPGSFHRAGSHVRAAGGLVLLMLLVVLRRRGAISRSLLGLAATCWLAACAGDSPPPAAGAAGRAGRHGGIAGEAAHAGSGDEAAAGGGAGDAAADGGITSALCPQLGWCELPDTKLEAACPDAGRYPAIQGYEGCSGVINDWSGGMADTKRNRLLLWGGGHHGYFGNELYALELSRGVLVRLNEPSDIAGVDLDECKPPERYQDGKPSSRHTYDGLVYVAHADKLFTLAGAGLPCGYALRTTWTLDLAGLAWHEMKADPYPTRASYGVVSDYDPVTKRVILDDGYNLWAYELEKDSYVLLNDSDKTNAHIDYHMTGRVDPEHGLFVVIGGGSAAGGGMQVFDLRGDYAQQSWTGQVSGCDALLAANSPGWAYDPDQKRLVGWAGGDLVYVFDPETQRCSTQTFAGGPGKQNENGTFGRFRYFPELRLFAVVNDYRSNAFTLRLTR